MDPISQLVLGAGVGAAMLGRRIGAQRAAIVGGAIAILPDLDIFWPYADPVAAMTWHRGPTHSLLIQALATPLLAEPLMRLFQGLRERRWLTWLAVYLCLATHSLLDALTIYGTQLLWPLDRTPYGLGSVFVIDPLYTLPLLVALVWALATPGWSRGFARVLAGALVLSTAYLGWGVAAQALATTRAEAALARDGIKAERVLTVPMPFNTLFWRTIALDGDRYHNLYVPLLGGAEAIRRYSHPRGMAAAGCLAEIPAAKTLAAFSHGWYRLERAAGELRIADLRMGVTPNYVFRFAVAELNPDGLRPIPPRRIAGARAAEGDAAWLLAGILGDPGPRAVEMAATPPELATGPPLDVVAALCQAGREGLSGDMTGSPVAGDAQAQAPQADDDRGADAAEPAVSLRALGPSPQLGHDIGGDQSDGEGDAERQHDQLVELAQDWDEVGDQIDRRERIDQDAEDDGPGMPG
jgi:inner membrane protein